MCGMMYFISNKDNHWPSVVLVGGRGRSCYQRQFYNTPKCCLVCSLMASTTVDIVDKKMGLYLGTDTAFLDFLINNSLLGNE